MIGKARERIKMKPGFSLRKTLASLVNEDGGDDA